MILVLIFMIYFRYNRVGKEEMAMKKTISSNRLTIDLTDEAKSILEKLKAKMQKPFGQIINTTVTTVCDAPIEVKEETLNFYKRNIKLLTKQMDSASPFELRAISEKIEAYMNLAMLVNGGERISIDEINNEPDMTQYKIEGGYVVCPEDWIVLNPEEAGQCCYAGVVECRRKEYHVPHFLFFTNKRANRYDDKLYSRVNRMCCQKWPKFKEILAQQVQPIDDPNNPGFQLNADEWMAAPTLGYFALYVKGDPAPDGFVPPMGAMVVRNS